MSVEGKLKWRETGATGYGCESKKITRCTEDTEIDSTKLRTIRKPSGEERN